MKNLSTLWLLLITAFIFSCKSQKSATSDSSGEIDLKHVVLDTMTIHPVEPTDLNTYKPSKERKWDITHTLLDLSFDWKSETVKGRAELTLTPLFYAQDSLRINAVNFNVQRITLNNQPFTNYQNNGSEIVMAFPAKYEKGQHIKVEITYSAHPSASPQDAGTAITSDKGLFFIDPQDTIEGVPMQIWTQGETSFNRRWFPTLDQPNERFTQEVILTVEDTLLTLSNGSLISSTPQPGGMRRDHYKLDLPHAPYLVMIAVGSWDKETDYWRGRPLEYYVDEGYGPSARDIFAHTPEMLDFFSKKLNYEFVWPKYSQVIVKDFVSGAMENTTAVVFGDFIQFDKSESIEDGTNDYIVAHEMAHHWFGDLVTCESWANLVLNEGFANYAEYLWFEYKYGRDRADLSRMEELSGYFDQATYDAHPLVHYHYVSEDAMFDAHSYNKGGLVLHMLRDLLGDTAFFQSLNFYLKEHAFKSAEVDDLRQAFEEVTGRDLNWFFDQWYFSTGHPVVKVEHEFDQRTGKLKVDFSQTQNEEGFRDVFRLPVEIAVVRQDSSMVTYHVVLDALQNHFEFAEPFSPLAVIIDPRDILLAVVHHEVNESEYAIRAMSDIAISHRISAFRLMTTMPDAVLESFMRDSSSSIRAMALSRLAEEENVERLAEMVKNENTPSIQYFLLETLRESENPVAKDLAVKVLQTTNKEPLIYSALMTLAYADTDDAVHWLTHFKDMKGDAIYTARAVINARYKGGDLNLQYFKTKEAARIKEEYINDLIGALAYYLSGQPDEVQDQGLKLAESDFYLNAPDPEYRQLYIITGLLQQYGIEENEEFQDKLIASVNTIYDQMSDEYLKGILKEGLGDLID
jgi:aminopeptidase N